MYELCTLGAINSFNQKINKSKIEYFFHSHCFAMSARQWGEQLNGDLIRRLDVPSIIAGLVLSPETDGTVIVVIRVSFINIDLFVPTVPLFDRLMPAKNSIPS